MGAGRHLGADIVDGVRRVKAKKGPHLIVWGSSTLTSVLLEHGLADEVMLLVIPVLLGTGLAQASGSQGRSRNQALGRRRVGSHPFLYARPISEMGCFPTLKVTGGVP